MIYLEGEGDAMLKYKIDIIAALKAAGYNTNTIRMNRLLSEKTLQNLREGKPITIESLGRICDLLDCEPGDLLERVKDETVE